MRAKMAGNAPRGCGSAAFSVLGFGWGGERTQFFGVEFRFSEGGEVAAAGWFGEADEVGGSFEPGPGRVVDSPANREKPEGTWTLLVCWAAGIWALAWYMRMEEPMVAVSQ